MQNIFDISQIIVDSVRDIVYSTSSERNIAQKGGDELRYSNLIAEMARKQITKEDVALAIGTTANTARLKSEGRFPFTLDEAQSIHKRLFSELDFSYLFERRM